MNRITKLIKSFGYAFNGIVIAVRSEQNVQIHVVAVVLVTLAGVKLNVSSIEWMVLVLCFGLVIAAELLNSAIETLVNMISPEYNTKAGRVKDIAAGAVLILAIMALIIGCIIFIPKLF